MKRTTVGGLDAPAGTPQGVRPGGAIDYMRRRPSQADSRGGVLCAFSLSILSLSGEPESSHYVICPFAFRMLYC